jgi:uncharacterized protein YecT (DUF1311 family)
MRLLLALLIISLGCLSHAAEEKEGPIRLATAPSSEYAVDWTAPDGPLRVVSNSDGAVIAELKIPESEQSSGDHSIATPLPFISPDSNWVFVMNVDNDAPPPESFSRPSALFRRTRSSDGTIHFEAATPGRFDKAAWEFLDKELKLGRPDLRPDAKRVYSASFIDWSRDSARLLLRVGGGAWSPSKSEWVEAAAYTWYCYFNTGSGKFELTDRLRTADTRPERKSNTSDDAAALLAVVTNAESIGEEGPQSSPKERFDVVDKRLNDVYDKLIAKIEPAKRESIRNEQRAWLISRDTEAEIAALQMWSSGREATARILESKAISTEARVAELEKLLSGSQVKQ